MEDVKKPKTKKKTKEPTKTIKTPLTELNQKLKVAEELKKNKNGRPNKYYTHVEPKLELITAWSRNGDTEETICKKLGVGVSNFSVYKNNFEELRAALKYGKEDVDDLVENALLKKALGFKETVRKPMKIKTDRDTEKIVYVDDESYYPPDTTAQIFWLKNRRRGKWINNDRVDINLTQVVEDDPLTSAIKSMVDVEPKVETDEQTED